METLQAQEFAPLSPIIQGPLLESGQITAGLDYYKMTMSQLEHDTDPDVEVTFTFKNRGNQRLLDYVNTEALKDRFEYIRMAGWSQKEVEYLANLQRSDGTPMFGAEYLEYILQNGLPEVNIRHDEEIDDIAIDVQGPLALATFWETVIMSELNEAYFESFMVANDIDPYSVYDEGNRRLDKKIAQLQEHPGIKIIDFGTRRHFSLRWQKHVVERLAAECPENLVGTSNVALANSLNLKPIGTFAHEAPMVRAGLADANGENVRDSHNKFLQDWFDFYGEDLSIVLTDTFTSDFFFADFTATQAKQWRGARHDSGDPYEFCERLINFYTKNGVDTTTKTIVFSDGLDIDTILALHTHFEGRIGMSFGWGTTLTNDLGLKPLNVVMKATHVVTPEGKEADLVKLSDNKGKHTGPAELVQAYAEQHFAVR